LSRIYPEGDAIEITEINADTVAATLPVSQPVTPSPLP
jgi:hypothetical protein